jgi:hypothetical protein
MRPYLADLTSAEFTHMLGYKQTLMENKPLVDPLTWEYADVVAPLEVDWVEKKVETTTRCDPLYFKKLGA